MLNLHRWGLADKAHSLVVLCHGYSADAAEMAVFADAWAPYLPHTAFVAPDAPHPFEEFPAGYQWFSLRDRSPAVLDAGARAAAPLLDAAIEAERARLGVAANRVALAGFSQGAMMALYAGLRRDPPPSCILAYSGALLDTPPEALGGRPPVLLVHGESDGVVPFVRGLAARARLLELGVKVQTCWRPGLEHAVDDAGLSAGLAMLRHALA